MIKLTLSGNITKDPLLLSSKTGEPFTCATVAVNYISRGKEKAFFIGVRAFGHSAEKFCELARKGSKIIASGNLTEEQYNGKDGIKTVLVVNCDNLEVVNGFKEQKTNVPDETPSLEDCPF